MTFSPSTFNTKKKHENKRIERNRNLIKLNFARSDFVLNAQRMQILTLK